YRKQTKFKGSSREIRGKVLKLILKEKSIKETEIFKEVSKDSDKIKNILHALEDEGFIKKEGKTYYISE
ncbi:MAG: A/G-specific adenine glycosylase, partial [Promethearchaeota archaeon]